MARYKTLSDFLTAISDVNHEHDEAVKIEDLDIAIVPNKITGVWMLLESESNSVSKNNNNEIDISAIPTFVRSYKISRVLYKKLITIYLDNDSDEWDRRLEHVTSLPRHDNSKRSYNRNKQSCEESTEHINNQTSPEAPPCTNLLCMSRIPSQPDCKSNGYININTPPTSIGMRRPIQLPVPPQPTSIGTRYPNDILSPLSHTDKAFVNNCTNAMQLSVDTPPSCTETLPEFVSVMRDKINKKNLGDHNFRQLKRHKILEKLLDELSIPKIYSKTPPSYPAFIACERYNYNDSKFSHVGNNNTFSVMKTLYRNILEECITGIHIKYDSPRSKDVFAHACIDRIYGSIRRIRNDMVASKYKNNQIEIFWQMLDSVKSELGIDDRVHLETILYVLLIANGLFAFCSISDEIIKTVSNLTEKIHKCKEKGNCSNKPNYSGIGVAQPGGNGMAGRGSSGKGGATGGGSGNGGNGSEGPGLPTIGQDGLLWLNNKIYVAGGGGGNGGFSGSVPNGVDGDNTKYMTISDAIAKSSGEYITGMNTRKQSKTRPTVDTVTNALETINEIRCNYSEPTPCYRIYTNSTHKGYYTPDDFFYKINTVIRLAISMLLSDIQDITVTKDYKIPSEQSMRMCNLITASIIHHTQRLENMLLSVSLDSNMKRYLTKIKKINMILNGYSLRQPLCIILPLIKAVNHKLSEEVLTDVLRVKEIYSEFVNTIEKCSLDGTERQFKILFEKSSGLIKRPISIEILGNGEIARRNIDGSSNMTIRKGTKGN